MARGYRANTAPSEVKVDIKSLISTAKDVVSRAVTTGKVFVEKDISKRRLKTCSECDRLYNNRCLECGCFINVKVTLVAATCKLKKW